MANIAINESKNDVKSTPEQSPYRLNLILSQEARGEIDTLKNKTNKPTAADVIRAALAVYSVIVQHQATGGRVVFRNADNSEETLRFV